MHQDDIKRVFTEVFGYTPLTQRLEDIQKQYTKLVRYRDLQDLQGATAGLLVSLIQLANESGWSVEELITTKLTTIERRKEQYHALGRKKRVALLGGAFNPITIGHLQTAQFVLNTSSAFDEVWFMPAYQHMYNKQMVAAEHRLAMCELVAQADGRLKVFDYEIRHHLAGETYNLVKQLISDPEYELFEFAIIIGQDNANTFDHWVNYEHLEKLIPFVIVPRKGVPEAPGVAWYKTKPHLRLCAEETGIMEVSSTQVRELLAGTAISATDRLLIMEKLKTMLPLPVIEYNKQHKLYGRVMTTLLI